MTDTISKNIFIQLNQDIYNIRQSWGEGSDYCQDEIMEKIEDFINYQIQQAKNEVVV